MRNSDIYAGIREVAQIMNDDETPVRARGRIKRAAQHAVKLFGKGWAAEVIGGESAVTDRIIIENLRSALEDSLALGHSNPYKTWADFLKYARAC